MELKDLITQLRDPDPWVRVEALRILAMVEETRALRFIEWVYKNDPEPGVKEVALWAGRLIFEVAKQVKAEPTPTISQSQREMEEELFIARMIEDQHNPILKSAMQAHALQYELNNMLRPGTGRLTKPNTGLLKKSETGRLSGTGQLNKPSTGDLVDRNTPS